MPYATETINLHETYVAKLGFELTTPGFEVSRAAGCAVERNMLYFIPAKRY